MSSNPGILVEVAPGELIDKITILEIKAAQITDAAKLENVRIELETLSAVRDNEIPPSDELTATTSALKVVNEQLWEIEDNIRECERKGDFTETFIELARSVYRSNDRRAALKRQRDHRSLALPALQDPHLQIFPNYGALGLGCESLGDFRF